jgi:hypothetical protein
MSCIFLSTLYGCGGLGHHGWTRDSLYRVVDLNFGAFHSLFQSFCTGNKAFGAYERHIMQTDGRSARS